VIFAACSSRRFVRGTVRSSAAARLGVPAVLSSDAMAKPTKRRVEGGRVTPKGGPAKSGAKGASSSASTSGRYTPPSYRPDQMPSPRWVPVLMFTLLALGVIVIVLNYVDVVLPGATSNGYLLLGLAFILGGIITATQYR